MTRYFIYCFLVGMLVFCAAATVFSMGGKLQFTGIPASKYAYALRFNPADTGEQYLVRFDTENNILLNEIKLPYDSGYNNFAADEVGGCYISKRRNSLSYGEEIYYYNPVQNKIELYYKFSDIFGPGHLILTKEYLIAFVKGNNRTRTKNGIVFINRQTKEIDQEIFFKEEDPQYLQFDMSDFFFDRQENLIYFTTWDIRCRAEKLFPGRGEIYICDAVQEKIARSLSIPSEYAYNEGVVEVKNLIYIAPTAKEVLPGDNFFAHNPPNWDVIVLSNDGKITDKIRVMNTPQSMAYDPDSGKIFVWAANYKSSGVKIIDTETNKVVGELPEVKHIFMASLVAPGKLYVTTSDYKGENAIVFFDTRTNKILGSASGVYTGISR